MVLTAPGEPIQLLLCGTGDQRCLSSSELLGKSRTTAKVQLDVTESFASRVSLSPAMTLFSYLFVILSQLIFLDDLCLMNQEDISKHQFLLSV